METINSLCAIIVLYKVQLEESLAFKTLQESLRKIDKKMNLVIYDNAPYSYQNRDYDEFIIKYIPDSNNSGVSRAYNQGCKYAEIVGCKYILLLDQDTALNDDFIQNSLECLLLDVHLVAPLLTNGEGTVLSPCGFYLGRGHSLPMKKYKIGYNKIRYRNFLNSGIIISVSLFKKVGGYNEMIPLYYSDFNFICRAKKYITQYYISENICLHDMASADYSNVSIALKRFRYYMIGAYGCYDTLFMKLVMFMNVFCRALKLFWRTKEIGFIYLVFSRSKQ